MHIESISSDFTETELNIIDDVIQKLHIRHCIFIGERDVKDYKFWKKFAKKLFVTVFYEGKSLADYIYYSYRYSSYTSNDLRTNKVLVILNDGDLLIMEEILNSFFHVSGSCTADYI